VDSLEKSRWLRLKLLLNEALELTGESRLRYCETLQPDDVPLRKELQKMLAEYERIEGQSLPSAMDLAAPLFLDSLDDDLELDRSRVGQNIGVYKLTRLLGTGGMGAVYLAEHTTPEFTHVVALKVVRRSLGSQVASERFERERRILAALKHPGIALLFDGGQTPEGQAFYTMEYVEGESITDFCKEHASSVPERLELLLQVASTLAYAHQNLIVHRDIKPSNVLVTPDGRVKLVDFGLAKLLDEHKMPSMTAEGLGPMTPIYAAPEQFSNEQTTVGTDVYQFGALCFVVLTGGLPYRADPHDSLAWARAVTEAEPQSLRAAFEKTCTDEGKSAHPAVRKYKRQLTTDLDAIVRKSLNKAQSRRYRSMDAMISDLENVLEGRPVGARRAGPWYLLWRFVLRRRYLVAGLLAAAIILTVDFSVFLRTAAEHAQRFAHESEVRESAHSMLADLLRLDAGHPPTQTPTSSLQALDWRAAQILRLFDSNLQHRAIASGVLAGSYLEIGHPERANALLRETLKAIEPVREKLPDDTLQLDLLATSAAWELGDRATAEHSLRRAEATIAALNLPRQAPTRLAEATMRLQLAPTGSRAERAANAMDLLRRSDTSGLSRTLEFATLLRVAADATDDDALASSLLERAWIIVAQHYGDNSPAAFHAQRRLLLRDSAGPRRFDALRLLDEQETHLRDLFGETSLDYADVLSVRCRVLASLGDAIAAETNCNRALSTIRQSRDFVPAAESHALSDEVDALLKLDRIQAALDLVGRFMGTRAGAGPKPAMSPRLYLQLSLAHCKLGTFDEVPTQTGSTTHPADEPNEPTLGSAVAPAIDLANCLLEHDREAAARQVVGEYLVGDATRIHATQKQAENITALRRQLSL
jgi:serine/threonine-protein kinase